jgi:hypothetical protein
MNDAVGLKRCLPPVIRDVPATHQMTDFSE